MSEVLRFVHISDTHIGADEGFILQGVNPFQRAKSIIAAINALDPAPAFVLHSGDVCADPVDGFYTCTRRAFDTLKCPIYYVNGNHDSAELIRQHLPMGERTDLNVPGLCYTFHAQGVHFIVLDAKGPIATDPHGLMPTEQLEILSRLRTELVGPVIVAIHYPVLELDCTWLDRMMLITNGNELHNILRSFGSKLLGVLFGHVHHDTTLCADGVFYSSVGGAMTFNTMPKVDEIGCVPNIPPSFHLVSVDKGRLIVKVETVIER